MSLSDGTIEVSDLLDENGKVDPKAVRARASQGRIIEDTNRRRKSAKCIRIRQWLRVLDSTSAVGERLGIASSSAMSKHARGECKCDHNRPPMYYGWGKSTHEHDGDGNTQVTPMECRRIRERILRGEAIIEIGESLDMCKGTVRRHATGECSHPPDAHTHPPLRYGWHEVEE